MPRTAPPAKKRGWLGKALAGLFVLVLVIGIANRWLLSKETTEPHRTPAPGQAQLLPTQTPPASESDTETQPGYTSAIQVDALPDGVQQATITTIFDGDTLDLTIDGQTNRYRLYHADTPETFNPIECGGYEAASFVRTTLAQSDTPNQVWVESVGQLDPYGRTLAYLWITVGGKPYLLNELLIESGWAENKSYRDQFDPYRSALAAAASYAHDQNLGVWGACGGFGIPRGTNLIRPTIPPDAQPTTFAGAALTSNCHASYIPCVPISPVDLDCIDVGFRVEVIGFDEYRLDNDDPDFIGCESW